MKSNIKRSGRKVTRKRRAQRTGHNLQGMEIGVDAAGNPFTRYGPDPEEPRP
jgi:hypothetical protein